MHGMARLVVVGLLFVLGWPQEVHAFVKELKIPKVRLEKLKKAGYKPAKYKKLPELSGSRRYDQVAFLTTHNAFSNPQARWIYYQQNLSIEKQFEYGVRAFMLDVYRTRGSQIKNFCRDVLKKKPFARRFCQGQKRVCKRVCDYLPFGRKACERSCKYIPNCWMRTVLEDVIERTCNNAATYVPDGPYALRFCHEHSATSDKECALTRMVFRPREEPRKVVDVLKTFRKLLQANSKEIVTLILEIGSSANVTASRLKNVIKQAGLSSYLYHPTSSGMIQCGSKREKNWNIKTRGTWPSIAWMRRCNKRLVVFAGSKYGEKSPIQYAWWHMRESSYDLGEYNKCSERGESEPLRPSQHMFLLNHFYKFSFQRPRSLLSKVKKLKDWFSQKIPNKFKPAHNYRDVNEASKIRERIEKYCNDKYERLPNFVAVDFVEKGKGGGAREVVRWLNKQPPERFGHRVTPKLEPCRPSGRISGDICVRGLSGRYRYTRGSAERACKSLGAKLCRVVEVMDAMNQGYHRCSFSWVRNYNGSKGVRVIPLRASHPKCGPRGLNELAVPKGKWFNGLCCKYTKPIKLQWVNSRPGLKIAGALPVGKERKKTLYVCRTKYKGTYHPGKLVDEKCEISWRGKSFFVGQFQVLKGVSRDVTWVSSKRDGYLNGAFSAGVDGSALLHICRAQFDGNLHPGKAANGRCYVGWGNREHPVSTYEVLWYTPGRGQGSADYVESWNGKKYVEVRIAKDKPPHFARKDCPAKSYYRYTPSNGTTQCLTNNLGRYVCPTGFQATARNGRWDCYRKASAAPFAGKLSFLRGRWVKVEIKHGLQRYLTQPGKDYNNRLSLEKWKGWNTQLWKFHYVRGGWYKIEIKHGLQRYLTQPGKDYNSRLSLEKWKGLNTQLWRLVPGKDGWYRIEIKHGEKRYLTQPGADYNSRLALEPKKSWNTQLWRFR